MKNRFCLLLIPLYFSCQTQQKQAIRVEGELLKWHKVTLVINGPETSEWEGKSVTRLQTGSNVYQQEPNLSKFPVFLLPMELSPKRQPMPEISGKYISTPMPWWLYRGANRN